LYPSELIKICIPLSFSYLIKNGMPVANNANVKKFITVPEDVKQQSQKKKIDLELAHARFVRPNRAL
jgi:hypothetical protein